MLTPGVNFPPAKISKQGHSVLDPNALPHQHVFFWLSAGACIALLLDLVLFSASKPRWLLGITALTLAALALTFYAISNAFTGQGITEATWYQLRFGMNGLSWSVVAPVVAMGSLSILMLLALAAMTYRNMRRRQRKNPITARWATPASMCVGLAALMLNPAVLQSANALTFLVGRDGYVRELRERAVAVPSLPTNPHPKSLVYVYGESLERTFLHDPPFHTLMPALQEREKSSWAVRGIRQSPFTGWTIAGMEASQCGFPLAGLGSDFKDFVCLGDLLKSQGYALVYMGGADNEFAGKGDFYTMHGFDHVLGTKDVQAMLVHPDPHPSEWGVHDEFLFEAAWQEYQRLRDNGRPFVLMMLTLDTHPPEGYPSPDCHNRSYGDGGNPMLNAVHCSDAAVARFLDRLDADQNPDLLTVAASDHLQMASTALPLLESLPEQREDLWMAKAPWLTPGSHAREASTLDVAPTVLSMMGWDVPSFGLGRDLRRPAPTLLESMGATRFFRDIRASMTLERDGDWRYGLAPEQPRIPEAR